MKSTLRIIVVIAGWYFFACGNSFANNNLFLPGDAFFPTELSEVDLKRISTEPAGKRLFTYSSYDTYPMAFCGNAGYQLVILENVDDAFVKNLKATYEEIHRAMPRKFVEEKQDGKTRLVESNPIRVLFCSASFQFPKHSLGLRYNENWVEEAVSFGHKRDHLRLCCMINHPDALERSWRDAKTVSPLGEIVAGGKNTPADSAIVRGPLRAVVIGEHVPADYFGSGDANWLYVVDSSGSKELRRYDGEWRQPSSDDSPF
jgi:hypothetical protein